ncbi:hypothetical protein [Rothia sp. CCM 9419]|uniref:hypothetical protein n=1 Tax=Rothia sp. CCM 9419 TaxID=3402662 RepID=UPI003AE792C1
MSNTFLKDTPRVYIIFALMGVFYFLSQHINLLNPLNWINWIKGSCVFLDDYLYFFILLVKIFIYFCAVIVCVYLRKSFICNIENGKIIHDFNIKFIRVFPFMFKHRLKDYKFLCSSEKSYIDGIEAYIKETSVKSGKTKNEIYRVLLDNSEFRQGRCDAICVVRIKDIYLDMKKNFIFQNDFNFILFVFFVIFPIFAIFLEFDIMSTLFRYGGGYITGNFGWHIYILGFVYILFLRLFFWLFLEFLYSEK